MSAARPRLKLLGVSLRYPPYVSGGYEQTSARALEALAARGHSVSLLCGKGERFAGMQSGVRILPWLEPALEHAGRECDLFASAARASTARRFALHCLSLANYRATRRALAHTQATRLLAFNLGLVSWSPVLAARIAGCATLAWVGDAWPANQWLLDWRADARAREQKAERLALVTRANRVLRDLLEPGELLVISEFLRTALVAEGLRPECMHLLGAAIAPELAALARAHQPLARDPGEALRVVCSAMLWRGKGQHVLLAAAAQAARRGARLELHLAGRGPEDYRAELEALARAPELAGRVHFHGMLDRPGLASLLGRAHVFAAPAIWPEPFGLATAEAMAFGLAVVASDAGGTREVARPEREALVVPAGEVSPLARALELLEGDEQQRRALAAAARERAGRDFDHERFVERLEAALYSARPL